MRAVVITELAYETAWQSWACGQHSIFFAVIGLHPLWGLCICISVYRCSQFYATLQRRVLLIASICGQGPCSPPCWTHWPSLTLK